MDSATPANKYPDHHSHCCENTPKEVTQNQDTHWYKHTFAYKHLKGHKKKSLQERADVCSLGKLRFEQREQADEYLPRQNKTLFISSFLPLFLHLVSSRSLTTPFHHPTPLGPHPPPHQHPHHLVHFRPAWQWPWQRSRKVGESTESHRGPSLSLSRPWGRGGRGCWKGGGHQLL